MSSSGHGIQGVESRKASSSAAVHARGLAELTTFGEHPRRVRCDLEAFGNWCVRQGAIPLTADTATLVAFQQRGSGRRQRLNSPAAMVRAVIVLRLRRRTRPAIDQPCARCRSAKGRVRRPEPDGAAFRRGRRQLSAVAAALDPRLEALVALLVCDGLKVAEALALDIDDVSGRSPATTITVRRRGESKRIVLDPDSARAVRRCVGKRRSGPVFVNERSSKSDAPHRLTRFGADHLIRQLRTDDATEQVTANALRDSTSTPAKPTATAPTSPRSRRTRRRTEHSTLRHSRDRGIEPGRGADIPTATSAPTTEREEHVTC